MSAAAKKPRVGYLSSIDECVRLVTAFDSLADLKDTGKTYAPKFYSPPENRSERIAQLRVVNAFNSWNHHTSQGRPWAFIAKSARPQDGAV